MFKKVFLLLFLQLIIVSFNAQETNAVLLSKKTTYTVHENIKLEFNIKNDTLIKLYCTNSYGSILLKPTILKDKISFDIPKFLSKKRGILYWKTINFKETISGKISISSQQQPRTLETYIGPPSIDAGGLDYTMLVVIPTDSLDNPILDNSNVDVKYQFLKSERKVPIKTKNLIAYRNIYSPRKSGRMIVSSESYGLNSKEFDVNIMPAIATNFKIYYHRNHDYADGNQITTFYTSIIKDKNKNIVSDGSYIEFYITNKKGGILKASGTTINGVAHTKIIHPDFEESWKVQAFFIGISQSNVINLTYKKVIEDFNTQFFDNNREIKIGPLTSFMDQLIPDGLAVKLFIYKENKIVGELFKESNQGYASFYLNPNIYENGSYRMVVETAGIKKEYNNIKLW
ncbi:hypothetical protein KO506_16725 [Polaribacter vadi]|uniref:hypothetical protein n=1 Tax=Polaribacter TaxID=52959 RepID=UPI001C0923B7|nr:MULTISPECIES: hypothetical protein [Polaribacter]MBU3013060.1 hypothetical protein [Polaribacter vadi]MDO6742878.1 hypothetical protein [Polaribacter sp. 1_MG-2023]